MSTKEIIDEIEKIDDMNELKIIISVLVTRMDKIKISKAYEKTHDPKDYSDEYRWNVG